MSAVIEVWVQLAGQDTLAGKLFGHRRQRRESATFSYDFGYLQHPLAYALDPALPLLTGAQHTPTELALFGALADSAPDRWGRMLLTRRERSLAQAEGRASRSLGALDFLLGVRDDLRIGAIRLRRDPGPYLATESEGVPALTDLPELLALAERAERDSATLPDLQRLVRVGSSLGGARPKAQVRDLDGQIAIAKFPSHNYDSWNVMAWEKTALDLAAAAGITVPSSRLVRLAGRQVLLLRRFDRADALRLGYVSAMTMLEAQDGDQRSYLELAEVIERLSAHPAADLQELWRRIVFTVSIRNTDDHLRNHGFLRNGGWRLAPAFDLNPDPAPGPTYLSTSIDRDEPASIGAALAVAPAFRLTAPAAEGIIAQVRAAVQGWPRVARQHGLADRELTAMAPAFAQD